MEQTGGGFYREEECKIPMLVSSASNQVHFKVFSSLKDPVSLTLFKPSASHVFLFGTTLFLWELRSWTLLSMQFAIEIRDIWIHIYFCFLARAPVCIFHPLLSSLWKTRFDDNFFLRRVLCSNLKRTCRCFFFRKVHAPCNTNLQWRIIWLIISRHTKNIFFSVSFRRNGKSPRIGRPLMSWHL